MRRAFVLLVTLLLTLACCTTTRPISAPVGYEPPPPIRVWVSDKFTDDETAVIDRALDVWNTALNGFQRFISVTDSQRADVIIRPFPPYQDYLGTTNAVGGGDVRLYPRWDGSVVLHEMGHVLGLD